jgi:membrane-associated phospholipid phosphatase
LPDAFITAMRWVSELGHPPFMLSLILFAYWGWKEEAGIQLAKFLTLSGVVMSLSKDLLLAPRPFWVHPEIHTLGKAGGFGMPSGHAMMACVWLVVMAHCKSKPVQFFGWSVILLTGLSRVALGLHSPLQVVAGWAIGVMVFGEIVFKLFNPKSRLPEHKQEGRRDAILITILTLVAFAIYKYNLNWQAPEIWLSNLQEKGLSASTIRNPSAKGCVIYLSLYTSLVLWQWIRINSMKNLKLEGTMKQRVWRVSIGILIGIASYYLYQSKKTAIPSFDGNLNLILVALSAFATFLLVIGFPWFFDRIHLNSKELQTKSKNCSNSA